MLRHIALMHKSLGKFKPPERKKLISDAYYIGNIVGFYNSNKFSILLIILYSIRHNGQLLPSSACSSLEWPEVIFLEFSSAISW